MTRNKHVLCFLVILAGLAGCSSKPSEKASKPAASLDKIQGKAQILLDETTAEDTALNAGGPSVYLVDGLNRYRLFFNTAYQVEPGREYVAEGVIAQKAIDAIGDPDQGKNGYPLQSSCASVVSMAWPGLAFDVTDVDASTLRAKVKRLPARPVFLVTHIEPAGSAEQKKDADKDGAAEKKEAPEVTVAADKQRALLISSPAVLTAPLWEPEGETVRCKVVVDENGKIAELSSGSQLCEAVPWSQFRYKPTVKGSQPVRVNTEVEVRFDPRK